MQNASLDIFAGPNGVVWGSIAGLSPAAINYHCNHISGLYVTTGSAADTVNVLATTTPVYLNSRGGQDVVYVGDDHSVHALPAS